jgi:broad specificity phosphatase PhoE
MNRGQQALESLRDAGCQRAVVVAHGGLLTAAFKGLLEIPAVRNPFSLHNCSLSVCTWDPAFKLLTLNETAHLAVVNSGQRVHSGDL